MQFENQGNPTQWATGMNQAISQKADLIILDAGIDPKLLIPQLRRAKAANIKVLVNHLYQNGEAPDQQILDLIDGYITVPFHESGELSVAVRGGRRRLRRGEEHAHHQRQGSAAEPGHRRRDDGQARRALPGREAEGRQRAGRRLGHEDRA